MTNNYTTILSDKNYRPDWSVNDESNPAFIKNRPFYDNGITETVLIDNQTITGFSSWNPWYVFENPASVKFDIVEGRKYIVNWDGTNYEVIGHTFKDGSQGFDYIGNINYTNIGISTGGSIPFSIINYTNDEYEDGNYTHIVTESTAESHVISVTECISNIDKINAKFLPEGYPYKEITNSVLFNEDIAFNNSRVYIESNFGQFIVGQKYTVVWDGVEYPDLIAFDYNGYITIGEIYNNTSEDMPFSIYSIPLVDISNSLVMLCIDTYSDTTSHNVSIYGSAKIIKTIDTDYLPENIRNTVGLIGTGENAEVFNDYNIASGDYSHAEGRSTEAIGDYSHTEGRDTVAIGNYSHTEGSDTVAIGNYSHTEGSGTMAIGNYSHAEGRGSSYVIFVKGDANSTVYSVDDDDIKYMYVGNIVRYNGIYAKVKTINTSNNTIELDKTLSAESSLSNYAYVIHGGAFGYFSHVEGFSTEASSQSQHVQGEFNIRDTGDTDSRGTYAHIVGNGTSRTHSNAHTLDWNGNAWFAGDVYVGSTSGTNKDEGSVKLMKEVPVTTSDNGKFLRVVNGAWAAATVPNAEEVSF